MIYDSATRTALLLFANVSLSSSPNGVQSLDSVLQIRSTDAGLSFTDAQRVDSRNPAYPNGPAPTSGNGIQLRDGQAHAGRLIAAMDTAAFTGDQLLLSDDDGTSYTKSYALHRSGLNELQLAQLGNGSVLAVIRNSHNTGRQAVALSTDGGVTFGAVRDHSDLLTPNCQGSVLFAGGSKVLYAGPRSTSERVRMTVLASGVPIPV